MVGATRWFIAKPMNIRAIINGSIAASIAIAGNVAIVISLEKWLPELKTLHDTKNVDTAISFYFIYWHCHYIDKYPSQCGKIPKDEIR